LGIPGPILVAGEDPLIRDLLRTLLESSGYEVIATSDQADLPHQVAPSLALLDLDPITWAGGERLRQLYDTLENCLPIIALTAQDDLSELALRFDACLWFPKPFSIDHLLQVVRHLSVRS